MVKRQIGGDAAGAYAAAAVAAKAVVWVAIGIGLLPAARGDARRAPTGGDPRPVLVRALAVVGAVAVPMLIVYARRARSRAAARVRRGDGGRPPTRCSCSGCAMTLLAVGYLAVQYMLALGRMAFLSALAVVAVRGDRAARRAGHRVAGGVRDDRARRCRRAAALSVLAIGLARRRAYAAAGAPTRRGVARASRAGSPRRRRRGCGRARRARGRRARWWRSAPSAAARRSCSPAPRARSWRSTRTRGSDRGPQEIAPDAARGEADHEAFLANLAAAGVADRVRHVRKPSAGRARRRDGPVVAALRRRRAPLRPGPRRPARLGRARRARRRDARARRVLVGRRDARAVAGCVCSRALALRGPRPAAWPSTSARAARAARGPRRAAPARASCPGSPATW